MKLNLLGFVAPALIGKGNRISHSGADVASWGVPTDYVSEGEEPPPFAFTLEGKLLLYHVVSICWTGIQSEHQFVSITHRICCSFIAMILWAVSDLMYCFGDLRAIVKKHEVTFNEGLSNCVKKRRGLVEFDTPHLLLIRETRLRIHSQLPR